MKIFKNDKNTDCEECTLAKDNNIFNKRRYNEYNEWKRTGEN